MSQKQKRFPKSKDQILSEMEYSAKLTRFKSMANRLFPLLQTDTIYDAQTALEAVSGFVNFELSEKESSFKINDLKLDFSEQPEGKITNVMKAIKVELQQEGAKEAAEFLEMFAKTFSQYGSSQFLKKPMSEITAEEIISK